jgi:hypothetical protein
MRLTACSPSNRNWRSLLSEDEEVRLEITRETGVADILRMYGDIAGVMEVFGVKRVGCCSLRLLAARALTVEWAARIHRILLDKFLEILKRAVSP